MVVIKRVFFLVLCREKVLSSERFSYDSMMHESMREDSVKRRNLLLNVSQAVYKAFHVEKTLLVKKTCRLFGQLYMPTSSLAL